jgi:hypothetical protein
MEGKCKNKGRKHWKNSTRPLFTMSLTETPEDNTQRIATLRQKVFFHFRIHLVFLLQILGSVPL